MNTQTPMMRAGRRTATREKAARMLLTALLVAALAASSTAMSGHFGGHADAHRLMDSGYVVNTPWMF